MTQESKDAGPSEPRLWPLVESRPGPDLLICRVRHDTLVNPRTDAQMVRTVLETPDWVNVVALTPERRIVVVRQYRFGPAAIRTEIPGGVIDRGEDHETAARRELREETGYLSERWTYLGAVEPNPAFHDNVCHHWLAEDAIRTTEQEQDPGEDIVVDTLGIDEMRDEIAEGRIQHALVITALSRVLDLRLEARDGDE